MLTGDQQDGAFVARCRPACWEDDDDVVGVGNGRGGVGQFVAERGPGIP